LQVFSTGTEKENFEGFPGIDLEPGAKKEVQSGLILLYVKYVTVSARTMQMRAVTHPCSSSLFSKELDFLFTIF
jgi:hypothetical protein